MTDCAWYFFLRFCLDSGRPVLPIGEYVKRCKTLSTDEYCVQFPHPVLLHSTHARELAPTENTGEMTVDRMILPEPEPWREGQVDSQPTVANRGISLGQLYTVFDLVADNPAATVVTLGCSSECDVQINDQSVSKLHAVVEIRDSRWLIRDANSTAGTQVNDKMLEPNQLTPLAAGDRVTLGFVDLTFLPAMDFYQFIRRLFID
jgi:hypothetical protein